MMAIGLGSDLESISSCVWSCMLRAPLVPWSRMVASIPRNYQVDLTNSYRLAGLFSQRGGLVHLTGKAYVR